MAIIHASGQDNPDPNKSSQNLHQLATQMATLTHQLISFSEVEEEIDGQTLVRPCISNERPAICERKTALSPEYMADLAIRVERMCDLIFNLKGQTNHTKNLN